MARVILPSAYWGDIEYVARLVQAGGDCVIDLHEHYIKRSLRNRTEIMTANGTMPLSVCLSHADRPRTPLCDVRIDYSKRWQHQHWVAICSAYRSSPYFDMVADVIARFYEREWRFLADYNTEILHALLALCGIAPRFTLSEAYIEPQADDIDLRPKKRTTSFEAPRYFQLFSGRLPFAENLSILDLLMCEGVATADVLGSCRL